MASVVSQIISRLTTKYPGIDYDVMVWPIDSPADGSQQAVEAMPLYQNLRLAKEGASCVLVASSASQA